MGRNFISTCFTNIIRQLRVCTSECDSLVPLNIQTSVFSLKIDFTKKEWPFFPCLHKHNFSNKKENRLVDSDVYETT